MIMWLDKEDKSIRQLTSPARLAKRTGISRFTIYQSLARLAAAGWYKDSQPVLAPGSRREISVRIPADLLTSNKRKSSNIVIYGILQDKPFYRYPQATFTYQALSWNVGRSPGTVRRAIRALERSHWIRISQTNRRAPIYYDLDHPRDFYCREQIAKLETSLNKAQHFGEEIARAMVEFVIEQAEVLHTPRSSLLPNPDTGVYMEMDIYVPTYNLVVEFQGEQHFQATEFCTAEDVVKQQKRDATKAELLRDAHKKFVTLTADDLSINTIREKLQDLVPLRDLRGQEPIADFLDEQGRKCRFYAKQRQARADQDVTHPRQQVTPTNAEVELHAAQFAGGETLDT